MNWRRNIICLLLMGLPSLASAGWNSYLRLDGLPGEVSDSNHLGWVAVQMSQVANLVNTSHTNHPVSGSICFQMNLDQAAPGLLLDSAKGTTINSGTLDLTDSNYTQLEFFRLNLTNVIVNSVTESGSAGGDARPQLDVCLTPQIFSWNYVQTSPRSGLPILYQSTGLNVSANTVNSNSIAPSAVPTFMSSGSFQSSGVLLSWSAVAGTNYRIYAVPDLTKSFIPLLQVTAAYTGITNYMIAPTASAMFYVVEQIPAPF